MSSSPVVFRTRTPKKEEKSESSPILKQIRSRSKSTRKETSSDDKPVRPKSRPRSRSRRREPSTSSGVEEFSLNDDQPRHLKAMLNILKRFKFCLDTSPLGAGKTFTAMGVARELKLPYIIYITNASLLPKPSRIFKKHGFDTRHFVTFETLRGSLNSDIELNEFRKLNNDLVRRRDTSHDPKKTLTSYRVTKKFRKYVERGCLLILDEVQALKNISKQLLACMTLEKYIIESDSKSVVLELSGSPGSKEPHYFNMLKRFNIIKSATLYESKIGKFMATGAEELRRFCHNLDSETTDRIVGSGFNFKNVETRCFELYLDIIQFYISDSMPQPPPKPGVELIIKNGYYQLYKKEIPLIEAEIRKFASMIGFNGATQRIDKPIKNKFSAALTISHIRIEICKTNLFIRLAKQVLDSNSKSKVCLALNYKQNMKNIAKALKKYGVVIVWASDPDTNKPVSVQQRQEYIDRFNEPNTKVRVLIGTLSIISQGIDLDDRDGSYPRTAFESSSFFFMHCHQFTRRFLRGSYTESSSNVRFVYANCKEKEESILNALYRQGNVCKRTLTKQVEGGVKFPGEYEEEKEEYFDVDKGEYDIDELLSSLKNISEDDLD